MDYSKLSFEELEKAAKKAEEAYNNKMDESAKEGLSWDKFCEVAKKEREDLYFISKYKRLKQEPIVSFDSERGGEEFTLEEFKEICTTSNAFTDLDGFGVYATEKSVSDIHVYPSDFTEGIYRTDFSHIIWHNK